MVKFKNSENEDILKRDANGYDPINSTYDLFNPFVPYMQRGSHPTGVGIDRYVEFKDLSPDAQQFLKNQYALYFLNFIDLNLFGIDQIGKKKQNSILMFKTKVPVDTLVMVFMVIVLLYSAIILANAYFSGVNIGEWIWHRHQNLFSWYSRPLFIIPACYYAFKQKIGFIFGILVLLGTSLFWFSPPVEVSETVSGYLDWERQAFFNPNNRQPLIILSIAVIVFLFLLFYAFWHRNFWVGLLVLNIGNLLKIAVSVIFGGEIGTTAIVPTLSSIIILNFFAFCIWKWRASKKKN